MGAAEGLVFVVLAGAILLCWAMWRVRGETDARVDELARLAALIGDGAVAEGKQLTGRLRGVDVGVELEQLSEDGRPVTLMSAALPVGYPVKLHVRQHGVVGLLTGDADFDGAYYVDGAPEVIARAVLDSLARGLMVLLGAVSLDTRGGKLVLAMPRWDHPASEMLRGLDLVARMACATREASMDADAATPIAPAGDAYRGIPDDRALQDARADRAAEVDALRARQAANAALRYRYALQVLGLMGGIVVCAALLAFGDCA